MDKWAVGERRKVAVVAVRRKNSWKAQQGANHRNQPQITANRCSSLRLALHLDVRHDNPDDRPDVSMEVVD